MYIRGYKSKILVPSLFKSGLNFANLTWQPVEIDTQYDEADLNKSQKSRPKTPTASKV